MTPPLNPYEVLGVEKAATEDQIKRAYRTLAMKHHPDRNAGSPEAAKRFVEVNNAYQVLIDPLLREQYDKYGILPGATADLRSQAVAALKQMFTDMLPELEAAQLATFDLIGFLRNSIMKRQAELKESLAALKTAREEQLKTLEVLKARIGQKQNAVPNLFVQAMEQALAPGPARIAAVERSFALGDEMLGILGDFTFDFDQMHRVVMQTFAVCTGTGTATSSW